MTDLRADFAIFSEPAFLLAVSLACFVLAGIGGVMWYVQM